MIRRVVNGVLDRQAWADEVGEVLQKLYLAVLRPVPLVKDLLHGTWLGHALHPLVTDVPVGALTAALVLDLIGEVDGAKWATLVGFVAMIGAALTGIADYTGTDGKARRYGTIHSLLMFFSIAFYFFSVLVRFGLTPGEHAHAMTTAILGYAFLAIGAYIGGELVFGLGYMVDRHAWRGPGAKWAPLEPGEFPEDAPAKAKAGAQSLVVVRRGDAVYALHDTCAHAGCSLAEMGRVVGDLIECQCHGSRFDLRTGHVARGPATYDQPAYEVRRSEGRIEVRRKPA
jgi:nitrite reductase/ring-hydroxylating ferredoxin subunit/uncharacterized membrane protein